MQNKNRIILISILTVLLFFVSFLKSYSNNNVISHTIVNANDSLRVIDNRIDVFAQKSLLRMFKSDPSANADANEMLFAVKSGELGGIYKVDQGVPAKRSQKYDRGWWQVIPKNEDAVLFLDPSILDGGKPIIVFKNSIRSVPGRIDPALRKAWFSFKLLNLGLLVNCDINSTELVANVFPSNPGLCISGDVPPNGKITPACPETTTKSIEFTIWLQTALNNALGTNLTTDGLFGGNTKNTLRKFQSENNLAPTGTVNGDTQNVLSGFTPLPIPCRVGALPCPDGALSGNVKNRKRKVEFDFCWSTLAFYPRFKGHVEGVQNNKKVKFSSHREEVCNKRLIKIPGWKYEAAVVGSGKGLGNPADWEYGFIQTVRKSDRKGIYSGGNALECKINDTRDAFIAPGFKDNKPWYIDGIGVEPLGTGNTIKMEDSPNSRFPKINPSNKNQTLKEVCFDEKYDIWLAVKKINDPIKLSNLIILAHKNIELKRMWELQKGSTNLDSVTSWLRFGGHREISQGKGAGSSLPVLAGVSASQKASSCFKKKNNISCKRPPLINQPVIGGCSP